MLKFLFNKETEDLQLYSKETATQVFSCEYCAILKNTYFEEHLWTAAFNFGNLTVFRKNVLYWVEEINYAQYGKQPILSKCKINILSRTIHLFSGYQLLSFLLTLYLSLTQFRALIDVL